MATFNPEQKKAVAMALGKLESGNRANSEDSWADLDRYKGYQTESVFLKNMINRVVRAQLKK